MKVLHQRVLALFIAIVLGVVCGVSTSALAAVPGGTLNPLTVPKYVTPLVIPPVMPAATTKIGTPGTEDYDISVRQFKQQILPGGIWNTLTTRTDAYPATTVWSYGSALDPQPDSSTLGGGLGVAPAPNSSFNYPAFTVENISNQMSKVRWINELVQDPVACFHGTPNGTSCNYLPHLLPVDQTLHWANPGNADCIDHLNPTGPTLAGTDCETLNQLPYIGPVPIVTHVHGAHVNPQSDGYPEAWWLPAASDIPGTYNAGGTRFGQWLNDGPNSVGGSAFFAYENTQEATTLWYHDHSMGMTRLNVYAGPAGFWLIRGGANDTAPGVLPGPAPVAGDSLLDLNAPISVQPTSIRNDIREIPIVIQDRSFDWVDAAGNPVPENDPAAVGTELWYPTSRVDFDGFTGPYLGDPLGSSADISKIWNPEAFFNTMVVNGSTWPSLTVGQERYRFRLLNGCNSRTLNLSMFVVDPVTGAKISEVPFFQIGGDQGFLPAVTMIQTGVMQPLTPGQPLPVVTPTPGDLQAMLLMPAERADVIVDFAGIAPGSHIRVFNTADDAPFGGLDPAAVADPATTGQVMEFVVDTAANKPLGDTSTPVTSLVLPAETPLVDPIVQTRKLSLNEMISDTTCIAVDPVAGFVQTISATTPFDPVACQNAAAAINPAYTGELAGPRQALLGSVTTDPVTGVMSAVPERWMDPIVTNPLVGTTEVWELYNTTADAHPIHVHLVRYEIVNRQDINIDSVTGGITLATPAVITSPLANELGFKDTVIAYPGQVTRLKAKFDIPGLYVWHCHIVEHEDNEMMLPFEVVTAPAVAPGALIVPATSSTGTYTVSWGASTTPSAVYTLEESTDNFVDPLNTTTVASGLTATSYSFTGKANGTYSYRVNASSATASVSPWTTGANSIVVHLLPIIPPATLANATVGVLYSQPITLQSGTGPFTWSAYGLPSGLSLDPTTGVLSGTPLAENLRPGRTLATFPISIFVVDSTNASFGAVLYLNVQ